MIQHQVRFQTIPLDSKYYSQGQTLPILSFLLVLLQVLLLDSDLLPDLWEDSNSARKSFDLYQEQLMFNGYMAPQLATLTPQLNHPQYFSPPASRRLSQSPIWNDSYLDTATELDVNSLLPTTLASELAPPARKNSNFSDQLEDGLFEFEHQAPSTNNSTNNQNNSQSHGHSHSKHKHQQVNTQLYKTELCALFVKLGVCPYGTKCQFAHGQSELKKVERPPKWRSKPCANWSKYGSCRYGNRCCFKHGV